jgi:GTPase involved in cell partitioning and DNA repair
MVVGNKLDLMKEREVTNSMVDFKSQIRTTNNLYVSSLTGENVEKSFEYLIGLFLKKEKKDNLEKSELFENYCFCY